MDVQATAEAPPLPQTPSGRPADTRDVKFAQEDYSLRNHSIRKKGGASRPKTFDVHIYIDDFAAFIIFTLIT